MKHLFVNDYSEGAHPSILELLAETGAAQEPGYGLDSMSDRARALIHERIDNPDAEVHLVSGGTQANLIVTHAMLHSYQSVIAVDTGHINVHETGAIEATGHKVHSVEGVDGKITVEAIMPILESHHGEHMVVPRAVFLSNSTELGTVYTRAELAAISELCRARDMFLYLDGARLGSALASPESDLTLAEVCALTDAFYIGGTKNGALIGEAIVLNHPRLKRNFRHYMKQRGGLLAKGRVIGAQFMALFTDDLYFDLARHANDMAAVMAEGIAAAGYSFLAPPATNQLFPILPNALVERLKANWGFTVWQPHGAEHSVLRLVTSWATPEDKVRAFVADLTA